MFFYELDSTLVSIVLFCEETLLFVSSFLLQLRITNPKRRISGVRLSVKVDIIPRVYKPNVGVFLG